MKINDMSRIKKISSGFTLIELLIVVAIVGILASLLIPPGFDAIQKARQRGTQKELTVIAQAIAHYITDHGSAPPWDGSPYTQTSSIYVALVPYYYKGIPIEDEWGYKIVIHSGPSWSSAWLGMTPRGDTTDEFVMGSPGRDGDFDFDYSATGSDFYIINSMDDFDNDLIMWNGNWVCAPRNVSTGS